MRTYYKDTDSSLAVIFALIMPQLIMFVLLIFFGNFLTNTDNNFWMVLICSVVPQIGFLISFLAVNKIGRVSFKKTNIVKKNFNLLAVLIVMAIGLIVMFGFTPFVNWFDYILSQIGYTGSGVAPDISTPLMLCVNIFLIGVLPAIFEELIFRGIVLNGYKKVGICFAIIISSLMFALIHQSIQQFFYQFYLGLILAKVFMITGNIIYSMILHFFNNFFVLVISFANPFSVNTTDYSLAINHILPFLLIILTVVVSYFMLLLLKKYLKWYAERKENKSVEIMPNITTNDINSNINDTIKSDEQAENLIDENLIETQSGHNAKTIWKDSWFLSALILSIFLWIVSVISSV